MPRSLCSKIACLLMLALVYGSGAAFAQGAVGGYQLVSNTQVSPNERDVTYRARLTNTGGPIQSATATLVSAGNAVVVDGVLNFGPIPAGGSALSLDTFVLRQRGSSRPPVAWNVVAVPAGNQPDPATRLRIRTVPGVQAGEPFTVIVEAVDNSNNLDPNFAGPVTLSSLQAAVPANGQTAFNAAIAPVIAGGVATFTGLSVNNAADGYTFAATSPALSPASSNPFNVGATHLAILAVANLRSGTAFGLTAQARDANNNVAENFTGNIDLNAAATGGSNFVGGSQTAPSVGGAATFASLVLNNAADAYTVTANAVGLTSGISNAFNVTFTTLTVLPVASMQAGTLFNVQVQALDANGVLAENFGAVNTLSLINLQAAVPATGQVAFNAAVAPGFSGGVGSFNSLGINNAADGYTFSAQATSSGNLVTDAINAGFNVTASFIAVGAVANVRSGTAFGLTAQARDANNNVAENFTGNIDLNAAATGGSNFVGGSQTAPSVGGAATFASLVLNNAADAYTATANAIGLTSGISNAFNVTFTTLTVLPVANMQAGTPFSVQVEARDANGVLAENFGAANALSLINLQAAVPANGQVAFNAAVVPGFSGGVATFNSLGINNAANGYTFSAQAASSGSPVTDAINAGFNVTATHLAVLAVANVRSGTAFGLTAQARDANNNVAENFTGNIDLNAAATGGSNFVGGSKTAASAGGVASFASLLLNNAADGYTATANAIGLTNGISNAFNVTFTTLTVLPVASMQAGTLFSAQVEARDASGVLAENFGAANTLSLINLQAAVPASGQVAFNAAVVPGFSGGVATFTNLAINNAANGYTFSAQATSSGSPVTDAINASFNVTATHLAVTTNLAGQTTGTPFNVAAQARDANNSLAENFVGNINLNAAATGGANFNGGQQTVGALAGAAAFNNLVLNTAANGYVVTASAVGLTSGLSNSFNVAAGGGNGGADSLELDLSQSTVGAGGTITITAIVRDSLGDPISPAPQVVFQILIDEGASGSTPTLLNNVIQTSADTRGGYVLRGTVNGTAVTDDVLFAVTQNAAQSKNAGKFVTLAAAEGTVGLKLDELLVAFENGNLAAIPAINAALQAARNSVVVTGRNAVQRGRPVAPEVGFLPSLAQLNAAGFTETPADAAFGLLIPQIVAKLDQVRQFYDALPTNPASGGADSVAALNQLNNELAALQGQLEGLDITPHAVVKHATAINNLIRNTMPAHMRSIAGKVGSVLQGNGLASLDATPGEFFDGVAPSGAQLARISPADFYGQPQPAFFGLLGLFGGCSLQMNLVNRIYGPVMAQVSRMLVILAANALLQEYLNPAVMEGLITGGSLSFFTNGEPGSVIEGSGMNADNVASNEVFFIGGAAVAAVEGLINAFNPSNINSFDDIDDYFEGIVDALQGAGEAYDQAEQPPDAVLHGCILDGGTNPSCSELVYNSGFESVSSCSGFFCFDFTVLVLYHNKDTGHWASGVFLFID